LADSVSTQYGGNLASHDYAQECEASKSLPGTECKFPIAKAFDSQDGVIAVTAAIMLLDSDGVQSNTPVAFETVPQDAAALMNPSTNEAAIKTRSTYLFNYDASDSAGNMAEQVTFALVFNDITAPTFTGEGTSANAEFGGANTLQAVREVSCADNVDSDDHVTLTVTVSDFTGSPCTAAMENPNALNLCSDAHTNLVAYGTDVTVTATATCHDHAGIYGANGVNNVATTAWTITLQDTTPPVITADGDQTIECDKSNESPVAALTPALCYDNVLNVQWSHVSQTVTSSTEIFVNTVTAVDAPAFDTAKEITTTYTCNDGHNSPYNEAVSKTQKFTIVDTTPPTVIVTYSDAVGTTDDGMTSTVTTATSTVDHIITPHGEDVAAMMAKCCQGTVSGTTCTPAYQFAHSNHTNACKEQMNDNTRVAWTCTESACNIVEQLDGIHISNLLAVSDTCSATFDYASAWAVTDSASTKHFSDGKTPGIYVRTYTITDRSGHQTTAHINIKIQDPDAPIVQMIGCDATYPVTSESVNLVPQCNFPTNNEPDAWNAFYTYPIFIDSAGETHDAPFTDSEGVIHNETQIIPDLTAANATCSVTDSVKVVDDAVAGTFKWIIPHVVAEGCVNHLDATPTSTCTDGADTSALQYEDQGASCHDFVDGSLSHAVEVSGQVVDMKIPGTYLIHYDCQDLSGNRAETSIRTVIIYDHTAPHISMGGSAENYVEAGFPFQLATTTCSDCLDDSPTFTTTTARFSGEAEVCPGCDQFVIDLNGVDAAGTAAVHATTTEGASKYLVTYTCFDANSNVATDYRTITVKDTLPPVITLHNAAGTMEAQGGNGVSAHHHEGPEHNSLNDVTSPFHTKLELNPAHTSVAAGGSNTNLMAESSSVNGWLIAAVASAVTGVALLGFSSKRTNQVMVPV